MADKTIAELAPTAIAAGLTEDEVKAASKPVVKPAEVAILPPIQPKRYREALAILQLEPGLSDVIVAGRVASMRPEVVAELRKELAAVKASPTAKTTAEVEKSEGKGK